MNTPAWLRPVGDCILGRDPRRRRHVQMVLVTLQLYAVSMGVTFHSVTLGLVEARLADQLYVSCASVFLLMFALVRSGWTQRFRDPVLTFTHALLCVGLCVMAYTQLGAYRANVMILIAQTIVVAMFRLRPNEMLLLGVAAVGLLAATMVIMVAMDPIAYPPGTIWAQFTIGGPTLLMLSLVAKWVSDIRVRIARQANQLTEALHTVQKMATTDMLTGLLNRRMMSDLAENEIKLVGRTGGPLCMALIDIDHFKQVNDRFGHHAGDSALKDFAKQALGQLRQVDKLARWGGEEFLLMLPQATEAEAQAALERLRQSVETMVFQDHTQMRITVSAGLARALPGESLEQMIERADMALYQAKHNGRNQCVVAAAAPPPTPAPALPGAPGADASLGPLDSAQPKTEAQR